MLSWMPGNSGKRVIGQEVVQIEYFPVLQNRFTFPFGGSKSIINGQCLHSANVGRFSFSE